METLRGPDESEANALLPRSYAQPTSLPTLPVNNEPDYAQIIRPNRDLIPDNNSEQFDFRLQTVYPAAPANLDEAVTSGRSSISSGYLDLTQNINRGQRRIARPTSPETSF